MAEVSQASGVRPQEPDPLLGKTLNGRFQILETLGAGGMGRVYKAMQSPLDRVVALKVLNPNYGAGRDPGFQRRFFLEASMTSKLHHPNTITVIDYGKTEEGIFYIAMEFVEGETLGRVIAEHAPLPWTRALHITQQIARSLREAHKHGIIHRDLKPANVMVVNEETDHDLVKVLDFGLVKSFLPENKDLTETELTQAGVLLGSPMYMAPEQARNHSDPRSDIYSLGVVFYQMLTGKPPFTGREAIDVIMKHINEPPPPLNSIAPSADIPPDVETIVFKCLAKKPAQRYQSMDEVIEAIRLAGANAGLSGIFSRPGSVVMSQPGFRTNPDSGFTTAERMRHRPTSPGVGRRHFVIAGVFGASLAVGAVLIVSLTQKPPAPLAPPATRPRQVTPPPEVARPAPSPPPRPKESPRVRFKVRSEPLGARVTFQGRDLGKTPLEFEVPPGEAGIASAMLKFELDGYLHATASAQGLGPEVLINQRMIRLQSPAPGKKVKTRPDTPGYKDDPYQ